jgi:hypothetical protein
LDFAVERGFAHGGWCPRGREAEDGPISAHYELRETPSRRYAQRTEWNVRDSDATVAFTIGPECKGGTSLTMAFARRLGKPALHLSRDALAESGGDAIDMAASQLLDLLRGHDVQSLNVAGPRASQEPEVAEFVYSVLVRALC